MRLLLFHKKSGETDDGGAQVDHCQVNVFLFPVPDKDQRDDDDEDDEDDEDGDDVEDDEAEHKDHCHVNVFPFPVPDENIGYHFPTSLFTCSPIASAGEGDHIVKTSRCDVENVKASACLKMDLCIIL